MTDFGHNTLYYTADQAASKLRCTKSQVHRFIRFGDLRLVLVGVRALSRPRTWRS